MQHSSLAILLALILGVANARAQANSIVEGPKPAPAAKPDISLEMRGDIFMARKMYREAIDTFRSAGKPDPILLNKTGIAYHQMMQLDNARKSYESALKLRKDYVEAMNNLGTVYYAKKNYRRAISWYERALKIAPAESRSASVYMNLGTAQFARKKYEEATKAYQTAMDIDPDVFERHGNFGVMLEERTVAERAKYHFYLAKLYAKGGRNELAFQYLRKSIEEGLKDKVKMLEQPEFAAIKETPEFKALLALEPRVL